MVERKIKIFTFGGFDVFCNGEPVIFSSTKSKELMALLVDRGGVVVEMGEAIACLWEDKNIELSKRLYGDAVLGCDELNSANIECDLWTYLKTGKGACSGTYLQSYGWSIQTQMMLDEYNIKNKK